MKYVAQSNYVWKHKLTNKIIGKVIITKGFDSIDNYEEVVVPEQFKPLINLIDISTIYENNKF